MKKILLLLFCFIAVKQYAQEVSFGLKGKLLRADSLTEVYYIDEIVGNNVPIFNDGGQVQPATCNEWKLRIGVKNLSKKTSYTFKYMITWGTYYGAPCGGPKNGLVSGTVPINSSREFPVEFIDGMWMEVGVARAPFLTQIIIQTRP